FPRGLPQQIPAATDQSRKYGLEAWQRSRQFWRTCFRALPNVPWMASDDKKAPVIRAAQRSRAPAEYGHFFMFEHQLCSFGLIEKIWACADVRQRGATFLA